jgi:hypothetical protein
MTDWRQIQARIRKAKTSTDPLTKLSELYQRTRDAMVAWELGAVEEKGGRTEQAAKWYAAAAQRFRRAEWKKKAEEALARLGFDVSTIPESASGSEDASSESPAAPHDRDYNHAHGSVAPGGIPGRASVESSPDQASSESESVLNFDDESVDRGAEDANQSAQERPSPNAAERPAGQRKRRRGRRGGRGRRRKPAAGSPSLPPQAFAPSEIEGSSRRTHQTPSRIPPPGPGYGSAPDAEESFAEKSGDRRTSERIEMPTGSRAEAEPMLPSERNARGRAGDPALASRMARLESMLRRLLSGQLHRLDELDEAPAGPGVFLLSDSDQINSYYIEACQTLRIGLNNLVRGSRGGKGRRPTGRGYSEGGDLREKLADHLGVNPSKVSQYMKEHCVVRWIQLDDDAPQLAHFAIAVLRAPLNLD